MASNTERTLDKNEVARFFKEREAFLNECFDADKDMLSIDGKIFKTKRYWRKIAAYLKISLQHIKEWKETDEHGISSWYFSVRASLPGEFSVDGSGTCSQDEKLFRENGSELLSLHEIRAIAETRAKNRAIADLIAFGEVSAEEIRNKNNSDTDNLDKQKSKPRVKISSKEKEVSYGYLEALATILPGSAEQLIEEQIHENKSPKEVEQSIRKIIAHEMNEIHQQSLMNIHEMRDLSMQLFSVNSFEHLELNQAVKLLSEIEKVISKKSIPAVKT